MRLCGEWVQTAASRNSRQRCPEASLSDQPWALLSSHPKVAAGGATQQLRGSNAPAITHTWFCQARSTQLVEPCYQQHTTLLPPGSAASAQGNTQGLLPHGEKGNTADALLSKNYQLSVTGRMWGKDQHRQTNTNRSTIVFPQSKGMHGQHW